MTCNARQYGDQMICGPCRLQWDANDPQPPKCKGRSVGHASKRIERHCPEPKPGFNSIELVRQIAGLSLSPAQEQLCRAIADEAYALGKSSASRQT